MLKKVGVVAVLAALCSVVVATTAWGSAKPRTLAAATGSVKCGKKVTIEHSLDPSLIGGVVTRMGDLVIDGSIKARLQGFRDALN